MKYVIELEKYEIDAIKKALSMDEDEDFDETDIKLLLEVVLADFLLSDSKDFKFNNPSIKYEEYKQIKQYY